MERQVGLANTSLESYTDTKTTRNSLQIVTESEMRLETTNLYYISFQNHNTSDSNQAIFSVFVVSCLKHETPTNPPHKSTLSESNNQKTPYQVIQFVIFLSPTVGGSRFANLQNDHFDNTIPKKKGTQSQNCQTTV